MIQDKPRHYHFGTDIPIPTMEEVEAERARTGEDDSGRVLTIMAVAVAIFMIGAVAILLAFFNGSANL